MYLHQGAGALWGTWMWLVDMTPNMHTAEAAGFSLSLWRSTRPHMCPTVNLPTFLQVWRLQRKVPSLSGSCFGLPPLQCWMPLNTQLNTLKYNVLWPTEFSPWSCNCWPCFYSRVERLIFHWNFLELITISSPRQLYSELCAKEVISWIYVNAVIVGEMWN